MLQEEDEDLARARKRALAFDDDDEEDEEDEAQEDEEGEEAQEDEEEADMVDWATLLLVHNKPCSVGNPVSF